MNLSQLRYAITSHLRQSSISSVDIKYYVELANELIELDGANNIKSLSLNVTALAAQLTNCEVKAQQYRLIAELLLDIRSKQPSRPFECLNITCSDCGEKAEYSYSFFRYECKSCNTRVRAHRGDHWPMGQLANSTISYCRRFAHRLFEDNWVTYYGSRKVAYQHLSSITGVPINELHFGVLINNTLDAHRVNMVLSAFNPRRAA
ncbi:hypothetical protein UA38_11870 [Photobacterium kishitanii]|uniref:zinc-finger-containing protein n=1 Tax=Photobacterium kishitanii TaxID=318456 RepID=UPI0005D3C12C|nr:zinc-finger-containing protein [Photobacterium kishitanii]KJG57066.1 hypothetical protein UA38_11870 [Photobacterium kishitanii]KJG60592.1 hypothetical protein UA42_14665 [Photobacterium kishitanii]KJG64893.1 hypothetical protein UA40_14355 [Photobacterium kishitanii]KJG68529.1 hypothetical protein UA41_16765 [Photobacterium kishitanii]OBU31186.1 hypothetical protein AYY23_19945 [Photobacterium kishitanii]